MSPALWALVAIFGSATVTVVTAFVVEELTWRRRERRETAAKLAAQQPPATPELDPVDAHFATAAALLQPDALDADVAALIRQVEAHLWRAAGRPPVIPGDGA